MQNKTSFIIVTILFFLNCFGVLLFRIPNPIKEFIVIISILYLITRREKHIFSSYIIIFYIFIFVNLIMCQYNYGQSVLSGILGNEFVNLFLIGSYFIFSCLKVKRRVLENSIDYLCIIFCTCYLVQQAVFPYVIFEGASSVNVESTETFRIRLTGQAISFLAYAKSLNSLLIEKHCNKKYYYMLITSILVTIFLGFRVQILSLAILSLFMIFKIKGFKSDLFKYVFIGTLLFVILSFIPAVNTMIESTLERSQDQNFNNSDYVRLREYNYYTEVHLNGFSEWFWGSGLPGLNSSYSTSIDDLKDNGLVWADWGMIGLSWLLGIPAVTIFVFILLKCLFLKRNKDHMYVTVWILFLLLGTIFQREFYRVGNPFVIGMILYLSELVHKSFLLNENRNNNLSLRS